MDFFGLENLEEISPSHERVNNYISQLLSILRLSLNFEPFVNFYFSCESFFLLEWKIEPASTYLSIFLKICQLCFLPASRDLAVA